MHLDIADRLSEYLRDEEPGVLAAYLFGSRAEGRGHRQSDVDVGLLLDREIFPTRAERAEARIILGSGVIAALHENEVDLVVLNDAPPELARHIVTRGVRAYVANAEADHAFVRDAQLRAADIKPFLDRMRRIKLKALRS